MITLHRLTAVALGALVALPVATALAAPGKGKALVPATEVRGKAPKPRGKSDGLVSASKVRGKAQAPRPRPKAPDVDGFRGKLQHVSTNAQGAIRHLTIKGDGQTKMFDGCGAKLANLPQLLWAKERGATLSIEYRARGKPCLTMAGI